MDKYWSQKYDIYCHQMCFFQVPDAPKPVFGWGSTPHPCRHPVVSLYHNAHLDSNNPELDTVQLLGLGGCGQLTAMCRKFAAVSCRIWQTDLWNLENFDAENCVPWQGFLVLISKYNNCSVMIFFICVIGAVMTSSSCSLLFVWPCN